MKNKMDRSPVCCILGHVDVGKTKLLDKIRETNVQDKEIGGITQQIGATYFSKDALIKMTQGLNNHVEINGLLMIDTPGHDCFTQMRMIGVKVCQLAVVVVDIIKGLEKQTIQCIELLKSFKTPFIIALNKLDKIHGWKNTSAHSLKNCLMTQNKDILTLFKQYTNKLISQLANLGLNGCLYYENKNVDEYVSMVPVSALTGDGIPDLIVLISKITARNFKRQINENPLFKYTHGYVIDIKKDKKIGTIYYVILMNGSLEKNQQLVIETHTGDPVSVEIRDIYMPENETEMKDKPVLKTVETALSTKGVAIKLNDNIENIVLLGGLFLSQKSEVNNLTEILNKYSLESHFEDNFSYDKQGMIINVPAKSMANAIVQLTKQEKHPLKISGINTGKINKVLLIKAANNNTGDKHSFEQQYNKRYSVILNYETNEANNYDSEYLFDDEINKMANVSGVKILSDGIIYKLFEKYHNYVDALNNELKKEYPNIIKSFQLKILPNYIFMRKNPLLFGIKVIKGCISIGNSIEATKGTDKLLLGKISSIQRNKKDINMANENDEVCLKIECDDSRMEYGKQFDDTWTLTNFMSDNDRYLLDRYPDVFDFK